MTSDEALALEAAVRAAVRRRLRLLAARYRGVAAGAAALVALVLVAPSTAPLLVDFHPLGAALNGASHSSVPSPGSAPPLVFSPGTPVSVPLAVAPRSGQIYYPSVAAGVQPPQLPPPSASTPCPSSPGSSPSGNPVPSVLPLPLPVPVATPSLPAAPGVSPTPSPSAAEADCVAGEQPTGDVIAVPGWTRILRWLKAELGGA